MLGGLLKRANETVPISMTDWAKMFRPGEQVSYAGNRYQAFQVQGSTGNVAHGAAYDRNAVVFACAANRFLVFSEARFQWQPLSGGRPGTLFGTDDLSILEHPWPGGQTRDLLVQVELDVTCGGNSYWVRSTDRRYLVRLDPAKVKIMTIAETDPTFGKPIGERLAGYAYMPDRETVVIYPPEEVAHHHPYPHYTSPFIGMSWLSPCLSDVGADEAMTAHKKAAITNGAQLGYVVSFDKDITTDQFDHFVSAYRRDHERPENAGKTLFLGAGADVKTVSQTFEDLAVKATQGAGETRIAACAGVPPVIVGLSEGLAAATYSNYGLAKRRFGDATLRPLWGAVAGAFQTLLTVPASSRLWYDDRDIPFLREDVKDQAEVLKADAATLVALVAGGFEADAAIAGVLASDLSMLKGKHTGLFSVQLQPPTDGEAEAAPNANALPPAPATNGASAQ